MSPFQGFAQAIPDVFSTIIPSLRDFSKNEVEDPIHNIVSIYTIFNAEGMIVL